MVEQGPKDGHEVSVREIGADQQQCMEENFVPVGSTDLDRFQINQGQNEDGTYPDGGQTI